MARAKRHERTAARESALALLYSSDITEHSVADIVDAGQYPADDIELAPYAEALVRGVAAHIDDIDDFLESSSENWALDRMPVVDRAILRLAVYEMRYVDEVPVSVTINEAVELAKAYGGEDDSSRFVNGVLGRIARMEPEAASSEAADRLDSSTAEAASADAADSVDSSKEEPEDAEEPEAASVEAADRLDSSKTSAESSDSVQSSKTSAEASDRLDSPKVGVPNAAPSEPEGDFDAVAGELITEPFEDKAE